jgi:hypothetical protein
MNPADLKLFSGRIPRRATLTADGRIEELVDGCEGGFCFEGLEGFVAFEFTIHLAGITRGFIPFGRGAY